MYTFKRETFPKGSNRLVIANIFGTGRVLTLVISGRAEFFSEVILNYT